MLDGWKDIWDEPWLLCEIVAYHHDKGFMEGLNPKLEWAEHVEKDGAKGLSRGKDHLCRLHLVMKK